MKKLKNHIIKVALELLIFNCFFTGESFSQSIRRNEYRNENLFIVNEIINQFLADTSFLVSYNELRNQSSSSANLLLFINEELLHNGDIYDTINGIQVQDIRESNVPVFLTHDTSKIVYVAKVSDIEFDDFEMSMMIEVDIYLYNYKMIKDFSKKNDLIICGERFYFTYDKKYNEWKKMD